MPREDDLTTSKEDASIKVGSTGKVGVLMSRELDDRMKYLTKAETSSLCSMDKRKVQSSPISVPCGSMARINRKMERSSQVPILHSNDITTERSTSMIVDRQIKKEGAKL
jgi:hypothetical protein